MIVKKITLTRVGRRWHRCRALHPTFEGARDPLTNPKSLFISCTVYRKQPKPPSRAPCRRPKAIHTKPVNVVHARPRVHLLKKNPSTCREYETLGWMLPFCSKCAGSADWPPFDLQRRSIHCRLCFPPEAFRKARGPCVG